jgi:hypothetical protein
MLKRHLRNTKQRRLTSKRSKDLVIKGVVYATACG